jgi:pyruvate dehydrogenase E2 component (dihydrolipoamide acetyltransferase)
MIIELLMPAKSPTMTEGTLVSWRVKPGDRVAVGQVVAEIQTDKAVMEWESSDAGWMADILVGPGQIAQVNMITGLLTSKQGEDTAAAVAKAKEKNAKLAASAGAPPAAASAPAPAAPAPAAPVAASAPAKPAASAKGVRTSPVAAKIAAALGVDLRLVKGSGPDGRIVRRDVEAAAKDGSARIGGSGAPAKAEKPKLRLSRADGAATTDIPLSPMRQVIGKRLLESKTQIPHFYVTEIVSADRLVDLREQLSSAEGVRITVNDLVIRAAAIALRNHPKLSATWQGNAVRQVDSADISIAVAIPDGLITPIIFKAHTKNVRQIGEEMRVLAKKAQDGKLQPQEFQGGSFSISNLGMYGIDSFLPIVNPPQVAILGVAGIKDEPVVRGGQVVPGKTMKLSMSCDHRAVDGADAAAFIRHLRELIEAPALLLV